MDQWDKNMEYLEAYADVSLDELDETEEEVNRELDILDLDYMARESGEKPVNEWVRQDFKDLLYQYPRLRHWRTCELQAVFLTYKETINHVEYYQRGSMEETWQRIANDGPLWYEFAAPPSVRLGRRRGSEYAYQRWEMENERLWRLYHRLQPSNSCLLILH